MAKTIGQLTSATTIGNGDLFVIEQSSQTKKIAASVVRGGLVNADVDAAAAIAYSKLDLDDSIVAGDLTADSVTTAKIDDDAVTTAKIDDDAVTTAKIDDDAVTTAKILDANVTPAKLSQPFTLRTSQASTSGTSIDFTSIPSWAKRITVMFAGVSTSGTSGVIVQLGRSAGFVVTGYASTNTTSAGSVANSTIGLLLGGGVATETRSGLLTICNISGNAWVGSGNLKLQTASNNYFAGDVSLDAALDRIRITTVNGTDTFDAGTINISYEG